MQENLTIAEINELKSVSNKLRANILKMINNANSGHPGGSLSCIDILNVLFNKVMNICPDGPINALFPLRDRFILSKGHASPALYSILAHCGYFEEQELMTFRKFGSKLQGHPCSHKVNGVEISTGSLGQGLSIACGMALGLKLDKIESKIFVLMGDGETEEGSVWEAVMNASHHKLDNLVAIVDRNKLQIDGSTENLKSLGSISDKFKAFCWDVVEIDGHDFSQIYGAFIKSKLSQKPFAIVANTVKGKGISFMENQAGWHGKAPNDEQLKMALEELK